MEAVVSNCINLSTCTRLSYTVMPSRSHQMNNQSNAAAVNIVSSNKAAQSSGGSTHEHPLERVK